MQQVAQLPCFGEAWEILALEYEYFEKFRDFVIKRLLPYALTPHSTPDAQSHEANVSGATQDPPRSHRIEKPPNPPS